MSRHDKQFEMYAYAVKNELDCAYQQGRADAIDECIADFEDVKVHFVGEDHNSYDISDIIKLEAISRLKRIKGDRQMSEDIRGNCCGCGKEVSVWDNVAYLDDNGTKKYYCRKCFKETFEGDYPYLPSFFSGFEMEIDLNKNPLKEKRNEQSKI